MFFYFPWLIIIIFLQPALSSINVNFTSNNQLFVVFNTFDVVNNTFIIFINGSACFQSDSFNLSVIVSNTSVSSGCSKLAYHNSTVDNNLLKLTFNVSLNTSSTYYIYLMMNGTLNAPSQFTTPDGKSGAVHNVSIITKVDQSYLRVDWLAPSAPNGMIVQYFAIVSNVNGTCVCQWTLSCVNCGSATPGTSDQYISTTSCLNFTSYFTSNFTTSPNPLYLVWNSSVLSAITTYNIQLVPINRYGWGNPFSYNFTTNQSISGAVGGLNVTVNYPSKSLNMTWTSPAINNGPISQYAIWVIDTATNTCVGFIAVNTSIASNKNIGSGLDPGYRTTCPYLTGSSNIVETNVTISYSGPQIPPCGVYNLSVAAINGFGWGNFSTSSFTAYQCRVISFVCNPLTFNSFSCSWTISPSANSVIGNYTVTCANDTVIRNVTLTSTSLNITISDAIPYDSYSCQIIVCTQMDCGPPSVTSVMTVSSDVFCISNITAAAIVMASSTKASTTKEITVTLPYSYLSERTGRIINVSLVVVSKALNIGVLNYTNTSIEKTYADCNMGTNCPYVIRLTMPKPLSRRKRSTNTVGRTWANSDFTIGDNGSCIGLNCNGPLDSFTHYLIGFRSCTRGACIAVTVSMDTTPIPNGGTNVIAITLSVTFTLIFIALLIGVVIYIRRQRRKPNSERNSLIPSSNAAVRHFEEYYQSIVKDSFLWASEQFADLDQKTMELHKSKTLIISTGNEEKNRYNNIRPYEHNMVQLHGAGAYINASRICPKHCSTDISNQCSCSNCYLVTQGPLNDSTENKVSTVGDFWQMAMQYNAQIIVNLTKCVETYKEKCAQYWPDVLNATESHVTGDYTVEVTLVSFVTNAAFDERVFRVAMNGHKRTITQLQFLAWPDHSCPNINDFLDFYSRYKHLHNSLDPVIVHCSAGVGRSGTFILMDIEVTKISSPADTIDIYGSLLKLRQCRCCMVQNEKQYVFVHSVILEYLTRKDLLSDRGKIGNGKHIESKNCYVNSSYNPE